MSEKAAQPSGFVQVPNRFFDIVLPTLTDTELRVMLVVMRSTLGWQVRTKSGEVRYKPRDWIANSQFQRRSGRSSASISAAVNSLNTRLLLVVENFRGEPVSTPHLRRLSFGRLYYRLPSDWIPSKITDNAKVTTTTDNTYNIHNKEALYRESSGLQSVSTIIEQRQGNLLLPLHEEQT